MRRLAAPRSAALDPVVGDESRRTLLAPSTTTTTYAEAHLDFCSRACIVCLVLLGGTLAALAAAAAWYAYTTYTMLADFLASPAL
jgi:hypothetical protein